MRIGNGYDIHRLTVGRPLILGGITVPFDKGLLGHSDGDALTHAIIDALLGAAGLGDIGRHFPPGEAEYKDANSIDLLKQTLLLLKDANRSIVNVDSIIICEAPKLSPYISLMTENLAIALALKGSAVNVKAKTNEGLAELGRGEAIAAHAVVLIQ
jgi:2-C-methyl-D-erythritol 2,4-cyclodiphosphate synthase